MLRAVLTVLLLASSSDSPAAIEVAAFRDADLSAATAADLARPDVFVTDVERLDPLLSSGVGRFRIVNPTEQDLLVVGSRCRVPAVIRRSGDEPVPLPDRRDGFLLLPARHAAAVHASFSVPPAAAPLAIGVLVTATPLAPPAVLWTSPIEPTSPVHPIPAALDGDAPALHVLSIDPGLGADARAIVALANPTAAPIHFRGRVEDPIFRIMLAAPEGERSTPSSSCGVGVGRRALAPRSMLVFDLWRPNLLFEAVAIELDLDDRTLRLPLAFPPQDLAANVRGEVRLTLVPARLPWVTPRVVLENGTAAAIRYRGRVPTAPRHQILRRGPDAWVAGDAQWTQDRVFTLAPGRAVLLTELYVVGSPPQRVRMEVEPVGTDHAVMIESDVIDCRADPPPSWFPAPVVPDSERHG